MSQRAGTKQDNRGQWVGVQPTDPESDPIPVKLEDAAGAAHGVADNPLFVTAVGTTVNVGNIVDVNVVSPDPLPVEDTGANTNPRRYEVEHAFRSQVLPLADDVPAILVSDTTTPHLDVDKGLYIYKIAITNRCGFLAGVTIEQPVGTLLHNRVWVDNNDTVNEEFPTPIPVGMTGVFARRHSTVGTTAIVEVQIIGLEV